MKRLLLLLILLLWGSFSGISQSDTVIVLSSYQARQVIKDLSRLDHLDRMEHLYLEEIEKLTRRSTAMDSVLSYRHIQLQQMQAQVITSNARAAEADTNLKEVRKQRNIASAAAGTLLLILILL